jgi:hypothetical protein
MLAMKNPKVKLRKQFHLANIIKKITLLPRMQTYTPSHGASRFLEPRSLRSAWTTQRGPF